MMTPNIRTVNRMNSLHVGLSQIRRSAIAAANHEPVENMIQLDNVRGIKAKLPYYMVLEMMLYIPWKNNIQSVFVL